MGAVGGRAIECGVALADAFFDAHRLNFGSDFEGGEFFVNRDVERGNAVVYGEFDCGFEVFALDREAIFAFTGNLDFFVLVESDFGAGGWFVEPF